MNHVYPNFLPSLAYNSNKEIEDDLAWFAKKEEELHQRTVALTNCENFPRPIGIKDEREQSDTVELGYPTK